MKSQRWQELNVKDRIQYIIAICLIVSGILIAFISFGITLDIANGVLIYIAQAFVSGGSIFGISIYFKTKLGQFESMTSTKLIEKINEIINKSNDTQS